MKTAGNKESQIARADEQARQEKVRQGTTNVDGIFKQNFDDKFFTGRRTAYTDFATPQLEEQRDEAQKELTYSLARSGTLDSSVRGEKLGELQKLYDTNRQEIADKALANETDARTKVEDSRTDLIRTLSATGDAEGAANSAIARASALSQPAANSPLSQLFASFTGALGQQAAQERAEAASGGAYKAKFNTGLFGTPTGSVQVTR